MLPFGGRHQMVEGTGRNGMSGLQDSKRCKAFALDHGAEVGDYL